MILNLLIFYKTFDYDIIGIGYRTNTLTIKLLIVKFNSELEDGYLGKGNMYISLIDTSQIYK
jgi:hypothetical protein